MTDVDPDRDVAAMSESPTPNLLGLGTWIPARCGLCGGPTFMVDLNDICWDECAACGAVDDGDGWFPEDC